MTGKVIISILKKNFSALSSITLLKPWTFNSNIDFGMRSPYYHKEIQSQMNSIAVDRETLEKIIDALVSRPLLTNHQTTVDNLDKLLIIVDELEKRVDGWKVQVERLIHIVLREEYERKPSINDFKQKELK